jgi:hypothetical protein
VGILLTWGRAIMFIAFFVMMFLYYYLAKSEERNCLRLFGEAYERYRERTSFILPGDRLLRPMGTRLTRLALPAPVRVVGAFAVTMALCFGLMWLIVMFKEAIRTVPYLTATISFGSPAEAAPQVALRAGEAGGIPFVQSGRVAVARGPWPNAAVPGFAERVLLRLPKSLALASFLTFLSGPDEDVLIVFCAPYDRPDQPGTPGMRAGGGSGGRGPAPDPQGPDRVRLMLLRCGLARGASIADALADKSKRQVHRACIVPVNLARAETEDMIEGKVVTPGPGFPAEERWDFFIRQFQAQRATGVARSPVAQAPGQSDSARLVVVRAPILRTRLDEAFATEILDRLVESASFRDRLRAAGAGGRMVAVAFPRPGEDWYREHHRRPQISIFVMLAHLRDGDALDSLFRPGGRELAGAFTAEMDFKVQRPADSVGAVAMIGPRRDLEERWRFFLSGVGGGVAHHH